MSIAPIASQVTQVGGWNQLPGAQSPVTKTPGSGVSFEQALSNQMGSASGGGVQNTLTSAYGSHTSSSFFGRIVEDVQMSQLNARKQVDGLMKGDGTQLHNVMISMEEASTSFQLMVEMRNKVVESLQELMRMQI